MEERGSEPGSPDYESTDLNHYTTLALLSLVFNSCCSAELQSTNQVAQSVEHGSLNLRVMGLSPHAGKNPTLLGIAEGWTR